MSMCVRVWTAVRVHTSMSAGREMQGSWMEHKQKRGNMISLLCVGPVTAVSQSAGLL